MEMCSAVNWVADTHMLHTRSLSSNIILMGVDRSKSDLPGWAFITNLSRDVPCPALRSSTKQHRWRPTDSDWCDKDGWGDVTQRICIWPLEKSFICSANLEANNKKSKYTISPVVSFDRMVEMSFEEGLFFSFSSLPVAFLWLLYYFLLESTSKAVYLADVFVDSEPVIWVLSQFNVPSGGDRDWGSAFVFYSLLFWLQRPFWWTNSMLLFLPAGGMRRHRGSHNPNRQLEKDREIQSTEGGGRTTLPVLRIRSTE